jgi:hypothetical protein
MPTVAVAKPVETDLKFPPCSLNPQISRFAPPRTARDSMVHDVFSLHKIAGSSDVKFPFSVKDYQRYVFGDDKLAHQFGTDLAKAFVARGPGRAAQDTNTTTSNQGLAEDFAVAVLSGYAPTATHRLREHFTAYLNRSLVANNAAPARKIDIIGTKDGRAVQLTPQASGTDRHHVDGAYLGSRTLIILGDIRTCKTQEDTITESLKKLSIENTVVFIYLATLDNSTSFAALSSTLSSIVSPPIKDIDNIAQSARFHMTEAFARYLLGRDYTEFCRFVRVQDDFFARLLVDYAIGGGYYEDELYKHNFDFLLWELEARESI